MVTLDGRPERLLIERDDDPPQQALGASIAGRVRRVEPAAGLAFIDLGVEPDGVMNFSPEAPRPAEGALVAVEVRAQARRGKGPTLKWLKVAAPAFGLIEPGPSIERRLATIVGAGVAIQFGTAARQAADAAQEAALATAHPLPHGASLAIEPTRALIAIDVDLGAGSGASAKRAARAANLAAIAEAARLLRLKGLAGLVVIDLVGRGHDGAALLAAARAAFAPDQPGVAIAPLGRFGTLEIALPRRETPALERLAEPGGAPSVRALAMDLLRALEREARATPGARFEALAAPDVVAEAAPFLAALTASVGARLTLSAAPDLARGRIELRRCR